MTSTPTSLVIASQMAAAANQRLRERLASNPFPGAANSRVIDLPPGEIVRDLPPQAQVLIARHVPPHLLQSLPPEGWPYGLRLVQLMGVGIDGYPRWLLDSVPTCVARGTSSHVIAEYVLAMIFAFAKDLPALWIDEPGQWKLRPTRSVAGSTLGLYGWGGISQALARRALALGQQVVVLRRSPEAIVLDGNTPAGLRRADSLQDLMASSDHLVLAAPATADTREVINRDSLRHAKPGLHLINVSRGSLVDQDALVEALDAGVVARASLDVTTPEPLPEGHVLYRHAKVFITPHLSSVSADTEHEVIELFLRNAACFMRGETPEHMLDLQRGY